MSNIFFYNENCGICASTLLEIVPFFASRKIPLLVRPITAQFARFIPGVPAVFIAADTYSTKQDMILIGSKMLDQLMAVESGILNSSTS